MFNYFPYACARVRYKEIESDIPFGEYLFVGNQWQKMTIVWVWLSIVGYPGVNRGGGGLGWPFWTPFWIPFLSLCEPYEFFWLWDSVFMRVKIAILGFGIRDFLTPYLHFARNCLIISLSCDSTRIITFFGRPLEYALLPLCHKYNVFFWPFCPMFPQVPIFFVRALIFMLSEPFSPFISPYSPVLSHT